LATPPQSQHFNDGTPIAQTTNVIQKLTIYSVVLLLCPMATIRAGQAENAAARKLTLTLNEALAMADRSNPRLGVAAAGVEIANAGIRTARTRPNPDVNYLAGHQNLRLPSGASGLIQHWGVSQPIEWASVRRTRLSVAEAVHEASQRTMEETQHQLRADVKQSFYQALRRRGEIGLAQEALKLVEDLRQRTQVKVEAGEAGRLELARAESEVAIARTFLRSAQLKEATALAEMRALVSAPAEAEIEVSDALDPAFTLNSFETLREKSLGQHPALARANAHLRAAEAQLAAEHALQKPQPNAIFEYEQMPDLRFARAGIAIPIPFFNRRQGPVAEALAGINQAKAQISALRLEIGSQVEQAYEAYGLASQQVTSFESGVLRGAEAAVEGAEAAFRFGERGIIEVLDAQRVLRSVRLDYLNALYDRESALIELEQLRAIELGGK
jgi:cobalt-zinc-cadmium efflux system outer membrane protein